MAKSLKRRYQEFRVWQRTPYQVAPLSDEEHRCNTCGTHYRGNYCPRCGQSAQIGRYSLTKALLLFVDVWGLGNRGMFRTLRDLLLRPGYMIRDYLNGMQMAYFPPFKMLFLLTTLSIVVAHGLNISGTSQAEQQRQQVISMQVAADAPNNAEAQKKRAAVEQWVNRVFRVQERFPNALSLTFILLLSCFYYIFFRKTETIEHLSYTEFFIAMVYTANMLSVYETAMTFFCLPAQYISAASLLTVIPLKQLSGFTWRHTILSIIGAIALMAALLFVVVVVGVIVGLIFFHEYFPEIIPQ